MQGGGNMTRNRSTAFFQTIRATVGLALLFAVRPLFPCAVENEPLSQFLFSLPSPQELVYGRNDPNQDEMLGYSSISDAARRFCSGGKYDANVYEWFTFMGTGSADEIKAVVYSATAEEINSLPVNRKFDSNHFASALRRNAEALRYLSFAKEAEKHVSYQIDPWQDPPAPDMENIQKMISSGLALRERTKNPFLRQRYAFQIIRLRFQARLYDALISGLPGMDIENPGKTSIYYRSLSYLAGAYKKKNRTPEAKYLFAKVFLESSERRNETVLSFMQTQADTSAWNETLNLARTNQEKGFLHFMKGMTDEVPSLAELKSVTELLPGSPEADLLLIKNIQWMERGILLQKLDEKMKPVAAGQNERISVRAIFRSVSAWLKKIFTFALVAEENGPPPVDREELARLISLSDGYSSRAKNPELWKLALAYSHYLNGEYSPAQKGLDSVMAKDSSLQSLKKTLSLLLKLESDSAPDVELSFTTSMTALDSMDQQRSEGTRDVLYARLAQYLMRNNRPGAALLSDSLRQYQDWGNAGFLERRSEGELQILLNYYRQTSPGILDRFLRVKVPISPAHIVTRLACRKAKNLKFEEAAALFSGVSDPAFTYDFVGNHGPLQNPEFETFARNENARQWSKKKFFQAMAALSAKIKAGNAQAEEEYRYALGLYNISHFGSWWILVDDFWSISFPDRTAQKNLLKEARIHFIQSAEKSSDREKAARSYYMSALVSRLETRAGENEEESNTAFSPAEREAFTNLQKYRDTVFYRHTAENCSRLRDFTGR